MAWSAPAAIMTGAEGKRTALSGAFDLDLQWAPEPLLPIRLAPGQQARRSGMNQIRRLRRFSPLFVRNSV
jgi:hypothetical protein